MNFQKLNNIAGWAVFGVALMTYWLTMEETASYWDCGEFIAVSYKLEVPHPPGAPFFLLIGRLFSFLAFGDVESRLLDKFQQRAWRAHSRYYFCFGPSYCSDRKLMKITKPEELTDEKIWVLMGAGLVGVVGIHFFRVRMVFCG